MRLTAAICIADVCSIQPHHAKHKAGTVVVAEGTHSSTDLKIIFKDTSYAFMVSYNYNNHDLLQLNENIAKIYDRHVAHGVLTVRLRHPAKDILLQKADPSALGKFVRLLLKASPGTVLREKRAVNNETLIACNQSAIESKLRVKHRADYPLGRALPSTLTTFVARDLKLRAFDARLLQLTTTLSNLDLGGNQIEKVPQTIDQLPLTRLMMDGNRLSCWPSPRDGSPMASSLEVISLAGNQIEWLPDDFWTLSRLVSVNLSKITLRGLPAALLHRVQRLVSLQLDNNRLDCLPFGLSVHRHCNLSVTGNSFQSPQSASPQSGRTNPSSLFAIASLSCARHLELPQMKQLLPWYLYLRFAVFRRCLCCRHPCGLEPHRLLLPLPPTSTLSVDTANRPTLMCYLCSGACLTAYRSKPWRYAII